MPSDMTTGIDLKALIRTVPDFPRPGVQFRDITTLLKRGDAFHAVVESSRGLSGPPVDKIAAIESRGFIVGSALAYGSRSASSRSASRASCRRRISARTMRSNTAAIVSRSIARQSRAASACCSSTT